MTIKKNQVATQKWNVYAYDGTTGLPVTGDATNITTQLTQNWGALAALTDINPTEIGMGYYSFDILQAESNAEVLSIYPVSSTPDILVVGVPASIKTYSDPVTAVEIRSEMDNNSSRLASIEIDTASIETKIDSVITDLSNGTDGLGALLAEIQSLNDLSIAEINTEAKDVLFTDSHAELAIVPAANAPLADKINWLFMLSRNTITATSILQTLKSDAGADIATSTISDDGTTATRAEFA